MEPIYIPHLTTAPARTRVIDFEEFIPDLETLMPVKGKLKITHCGNYLEVTGTCEAITTLTCHRCLQQYNHRIKIQPKEIIWLDAAIEEPDTGPTEREIPPEDLVETLSPSGHFDPTEWVYQQLCLAIPYQQLCQNNCQGIPLTSHQATPSETTKIDSRWSALESLKNQLPT